MLIFLDFDGVLHPTTAQSSDSLWTQIPVLETFFRQPEYVNCRFVIDSTWRIHRSVCELAAQFSVDFRHKIIGATPVLPISGSLKGLREREVLLWLRDFGRENEAWIALDDMRTYFDEYSDRVFLCDSRTGLTVQDLPELAAHLARFQAA